MTKGYGFTVDDIDWSCPAELEPYVKSYKLKKNVEDAERWQLGQYILAAISTLGKGKYPEKPVFQLEEKRELTEEEKQREVDLFFAKENARRINWKRNKALKNNGNPN